MDGDKLDFLDEKEPETEVEAEAEATEEPQAEAEETESPQVEAEAEPGPTGETESTPPVEEPKSREVPITAMLDEREKRQKAEREAEEARKMAEVAQRKLQEAIRAQQEPEKAPDFYDDPDQRLQFEAQRFEQQLQARTLQQSRFLAEREYGAEVVNEAMGFFDKNPQLSHQFLDHPSPFHAAIDFYKQQKFLSEVKDPDEWRKQERERLREELMAELKPQPSKPKAPPASLATAPAAGTDAIVPGNAFDGVFGE